MISLAITALVLAAADGGSAASPAEAFIAYTEYVLDVPLTLAQRAEVQGLVAKAQTETSARELALVDEGVAGAADLATQSGADQRTLRASVEDEYLRTMRRQAKSLALAKWVVSVADARKPLTKGTSPLTRQAADALAELLAFVVAEAGGSDRVTADRPFREAFAKALAADYASYSIEERASVADLPRDWATLRSGYSGFTGEKRQKLKEEWAQAVAPLLKEPKAVTGDAKALRAVAKGLVARVTRWL
jgi:hypothetical protein